MLILNLACVGSLGASAPAGQLNKKGQIVDNQPLVFKQKVQSSGYSQTQTKYVTLQLLIKCIILY